MKKFKLYNRRLLDPRWKKLDNSPFAFNEPIPIEILIVHDQKKIYATFNSCDFRRVVTGFFHPLLANGYTFESKNNFWPRQVAIRQLKKSVTAEISWTRENSIQEISLEGYSEIFGGFKYARHENNRRTA